MVSSSLYGWLFVATLFCNACGASIRPRVVHERRSTAPKGFARVKDADDDQVLQMRINLAMGNQAGLEEALAKASDPSSDTYGQWLSQDEVASYAAPSTATVRNVKKWLKSYGIEATSTTSAGDWLKFSVPVGTANKMLNAKYEVYNHVESGTQSVRTLEYSLPEDLQEHINAIHPAASFTHAGRGRITITGHGKNTLGTSKDSAKASSGKSSHKTSSSCNDTMTPACLQKLYTLPTSPVSPNTSSTIGVSAFGDQNANKNDLKLFLKKFRPDIPSNTTFKTQLLDNGFNDQNSSNAGTEANLDIQYTVGVATEIPTTFIDVGDKNQDGDDGGFLDITNLLLEESNPPLVLTTSYGVGPVETSLSPRLTFAMCNSFLQLTARGVSILYATGDGGVASSPGVECDGEPFQAAWPTCPYATLVGATTDVPEIGADLSAGGFSNYFSRPSWQSSAVSGYLQQIGSLYNGLYNASGRAYPDVSAQGNKVAIFVDGTEGPIAGTSCSSPIFASVIALLNDERLSRGMSPLGFLNPWIYANPQMFHDITAGSNPGCGTDGFPAKKGWDPVTGMGTPNYTAMRKAAGLS